MMHTDFLLSLISSVGYVINDIRTESCVTKIFVTTANFPCSDSLFRDVIKLRDKISSDFVILHVISIYDLSFREHYIRDFSKNISFRSIKSKFSKF